MHDLFWHEGVRVIDLHRYEMCGATSQIDAGDWFHGLVNGVRPVWGSCLSTNNNQVQRRQTDRLIKADND